jgi:tight adherence protein B
MNLLTQAWFVYPLVVLSVIVAVYFSADRVIQIIQQRSLGQMQKMQNYLQLMSAPMDPKKLQWMLMLMSFGIAALAVLVFWPNILVGLIFGISLGVVGWSIPVVFIKNSYENRCNVIVDQMVDGLTIMANGVKSGLGVTQAMERVVENMPGPISREFQTVLSQVQLGRSLEEALIELAERVPRPDMQMFVTGINILKETGGNLAETFETIVFTIRERQKLEKKIQAMTAQGVAQGFIITLIPFVILIVFYYADPQFVMPLFTTTLGLFFLFIMFTLILTGGFMIRKIVKIEV